jgi:hypothetical protein
VFWDTGDQFVTAGGYDLIKGLGFADHAKIRAGSLLGSFFTVLEIYDLGFQGYVAISQRLVLFTLVGNCQAQITGFAKAIVSKPKLTLHRKSGYHQHDQYPTHTQNSNPQ